ncbi:PREDICTED: 2-hydroxyisoflavanone dehydratase [Prunus dulcis]|uniref:PREDICTED: 2-hydroxyisoflavanone dehydratase n=1 Tax=Prunus dulcis TaxID=3755 RepID=A0A5E4GF48_PRUDU|nr:PREDICTED: 2-hydroxyisoflavanone dehydratase [Prunus dulcis]
MASTSTTKKEIASELLPLIRVYKDGTVERLWGSPYVPPCPHDPQTNVSSKDITISQYPTISARLFLPQNQIYQKPQHLLPILVYFHGGGFCFESAFSSDHHRLLNRLVSQAQVLAVSVEYRLAPENPLPNCYQDCWDALQWVSSHRTHKELDANNTNKEPWLVNYGNFDKLYIGGDSAGGNIVHNVAMKAGVERLCGDVKILGAFMSHLYFLGSKPIGSEPKGEDFEKWLPCKVWKFFKDELSDRGVWYYDLVKESGWRGEVEVFEVEGEEHAFHILSEVETENVKIMIECLASFLV